jgi:Cyclophilin-like family
VTSINPQSIRRLPGTLYHRPKLVVHLAPNSVDSCQCKWRRIATLSNRDLCPSIFIDGSRHGSGTHSNFLTAELADNAAARSLIQMLPITIDMRDHMRQEKTGNLPSPLPEIARQRDFAAGTLGLWGPDHFVIYYSSGRVPQPGIIILGKVTGDVSIFDRPGSIAIRVERANQ